MENQQVWVRDPHEGFIIGKFIDMVDGDALIKPLDAKLKQITCPLDEVYPAGEYTKDVEDNCKQYHKQILIIYKKKRNFQSMLYIIKIKTLIEINFAVHFFRCFDVP